MQRWQKEKIRVPHNYSVTKAILDIVYDFGENFPLFECPYRKFYHWSMDIPKPAMWRYRRAMKYLESVGKVKVFERNRKLFVKLTRKGKVQVLLQKLATEFKSAKSWDGKWRLIIWDIPESSRWQRDQIRSFVKGLGFYRLQQSVFITPYPLPSSAIQFLKESGLQKFIRFLRIDQIDDDKFLLRHFKLKYD